MADIPTTSFSWSRCKDPRVVRASGNSAGKDRHSKVLTVEGVKDRRVRFSVSTAVQIYELQHRLGLSQPSKVLEWLLSVVKDSTVTAHLLPPTGLMIEPLFPGAQDPRVGGVPGTCAVKDGNSKVLTVLGLKDRRIRLSAQTALRLYDLQHRLGLNHPREVGDWLLAMAKNAIDQLTPPVEHHIFNAAPAYAQPPLPPSFEYYVDTDFHPSLDYYVDTDFHTSYLTAGSSSINPWNLEDKEGINQSSNCINNIPPVEESAPTLQRRDFDLMEMMSFHMRGQVEFD